MSYSSHIKANVLKALVQKEGVECEEKLEEIRKLLGLRPLESESSGDQETNDVTNEHDGEENTAESGNEVSVREAPVELSARERSIKRILDEFEGKYKKFANQILLEIEKSSSLSWDYESLELIIDSQKVLHSNIQLLLSKLLEQRSPTLPHGLHKFIDALINIKLPKVYFKGSDVKNIRAFLIETNSGNIVEKQPETSLKRKREDLEETERRRAELGKERVEESDEEEEIGGKRQRTEEAEPEVEVGVSTSSGEKKESEVERKKRKREDDLDFEEAPRKSKRIQLKKDVGKHWNGIYKE